MTFANVAKLQKDRGTDFIVDKKNETISFENEGQLKNLIDVLLDNFMVSALTGEPYRAINKRKDKKADKWEKSSFCGLGCDRLENPIF